MSDKNNNPDQAPKPGPAAAPRCYLEGNKFHLTPEAGQEHLVVLVKHGDQTVGKFIAPIVIVGDSSERTVIKDLGKKITWTEGHPMPKTSYKLSVHALMKPDSMPSSDWTCTIGQIINGRFIEVTQPEDDDGAKRDLDKFLIRLEFIKNELARKGSGQVNPEVLDLFKTDLLDIQSQMKSMEKQRPDLCDSWAQYQEEITALLAVVETRKTGKSTNVQEGKKKLNDQIQALKKIHEELGSVNPPNKHRLSEMMAKLKGIEYFLVTVIGDHYNMDFGTEMDIIYQLRDKINEQLEKYTTMPELAPAPVPADSTRELTELRSRLADLEQKMHGAASQAELNNLKKEVESVKNQIDSMQTKLNGIELTSNTTLQEFRQFANRPQQASAIPNTPQASPQVIYLTAPTSPAPATNPAQDQEIKRLSEKVDQLERTKTPPTTPPTVPQETKKKRLGATRWILPLLAFLAFLGFLAFGLCWMLANGKQAASVPTPPPAPSNIPDEETRRMYMAETDRANAEVARNGELQRKLSIAEYARERAESNAVQLASTPAKPTATFGNVGNGAIVANNGSVVNVFPTAIIECTAPAPAPKREIAKPPKPMGFNPAPPPSPQVQGEVITETTTMHGPAQLLVPAQPTVIYGVYQGQVPQVWVNPNWGGPMNGFYGYDYPYGPVVRGYGYGGHR